MKKVFLSVGFFVGFTAFAMEEGLLFSSHQKSYVPSKLDILHLMWWPPNVRKALYGERVEFKNRYILHDAADNYCSPSTIRWLVYKCGASVTVANKGTKLQIGTATPLDYFIICNKENLINHKERIEAFFDVGCPLSKCCATWLQQTNDGDLREIANKVLKK